MAVEETDLGFLIPDGYEMVKDGENVIANNGRKANDFVRSLLTRMGVAEANINAGSGGGPGLSEDPLNPGTYFMASNSPLTPDPVNPGLYTF